MMDFLFCSHLLSQPFFIDDSQNAEAFLGRSHRNKSQPKKLMPRRRSDEKKYSEWAENDSLGSVSSRGNDLIDCAELEGEEIEKKSTNPLHFEI